MAMARVDADDRVLQRELAQLGQDRLGRFARLSGQVLSRMGGTSDQRKPRRSEAPKVITRPTDFTD